MPVRGRLQRVLLFLGKVLVGLLLLVAIALLILHLPATQRRITRELTGYLSKKLDSRVDIGSIRFSILGDLVIEDLKVWDRDSQQLITIGRFEAVSSIMELLKGHYIFDKISIADVDAHLSQREDGMNIQFLIEAFASKEDRKPSSRGLDLQFKEVKLENIAFAFLSEVNGASINAKFKNLLIEEAAYSTGSNVITGVSAALQHADVRILTISNGETSRSDSIADRFYISPDFGLGIGLEFKKLDISDTDFSFHRDQVAETPKFDASHISVKHIDIALSDLLMHSDTLSVTLDSLSGETPGFALTSAEAGIHLSPDGLSFSGLQIVSDANEFKADFSATYATGTTEDKLPADISLSLLGRLVPGDFAYFFNDDMMRYVDRWDTTQLVIEGDYREGQGEVKTLKVITGNSWFEASGKVTKPDDLKKLSWEELVVYANVGPDFRRTITPFLGELQIPPDLKLNVRSSGKLSKMSLDGSVKTSWGNVEAKGMVTPMAGTYDIDLNIVGEHVDLSHWIELPWLGPLDLTADAKGMVGKHQRLEIKGLLGATKILDQTIHGIAFQGEIYKDSLTTHVAIEDKRFRSQMDAGISFAGPLRINANIQLDTFNAGRLLKMDSTMLISGDFSGRLTYEDSLLEGNLQGLQVYVERQSKTYDADTLFLKAMISPGESHAQYSTDYAKISLDANFDLKDSPEMLQTWADSILKGQDTLIKPAGYRALNFELEVTRPGLIEILGMDVEDFSGLKVRGKIDEHNHSADLQAAAGKFTGFGITLDTFYTNATISKGNIAGTMNANNLLYKTTELGNLVIDLSSNHDTIISDLHLVRDTVSVVDLGARLLPAHQGLFVYPDRLRLFDDELRFDRNNPVFISDSNVTMNNFLISRDSMQISLDGDLQAFDVDFKNMDLTRLNQFFTDTAVITNGHLNGRISYVLDQQLDLKAAVDSLSLYHSDPLTISLTAVKEGRRVPFTFLLTNATNKVGFDGNYFMDSEAMDASLLLDINDLDLFSFLVSGALDEMHGTIKGEAMVKGPISKPVVKGYVRFLDAGFTTADPSFTFNVEDDMITFDSSGLSVKDFTIYDEGHQPLEINGNLLTQDYSTYTYDLRINTDRYTLMNIPASSKDQLKGLLEIAADIHLNGNEKDRYIKGGITIKDTTDLTYVVASDDIDLLKAEGIVEFVDPALLIDSSGLQTSASYYDSLVASFPDFNVNSTITIENKAKIRIITNEQSGDYLEASGGASLELGYDRTGNIQLSGNYTIDQGVYRVSFYDLVKKNFELVKGSSIVWRGSPKNGDLDMKAVYTVASNSIGLIGHEIAENEEAIYKRSLDYQVGINIKGTIEKPIVSFSLDLPKQEKTNYPVLASKLERLKLPEYQSELNKQVFGLLVLGGFLPESSGADVDQAVIATTAITNSVNSLLAGQLNRFTGQYIKGVNIDVGLQSYADYSTPGGKTRTAMDFRVSKSILDDRLSFEIGGDFDINSDQSGGNKGDNYRGDIAIIYNLTENADKQLKLFNNESYDIIYQEIRNTGISLVFIREFNKGEKVKRKEK